MYSQTYRLSQDVNLKLAQVEKNMGNMTNLVNEATSKLDAANNSVSVATRRLEEANKILKETKDLLNEIKNQGIVKMTAITVDQKPKIYYPDSEALLTIGLGIQVSSPSNFPVYYESNIVNTAESIINISGRTYNFDDFAKATNAQTNLDIPFWDVKPQTLGTDASKVGLWVGLREFPFQRKGILLTGSMEPVTFEVVLKIQLIQAHNNLVMDQTIVRLDFKITGDQVSVTIVSGSLA